MGDVESRGPGRGSPRLTVGLWLMIVSMAIAEVAGSPVAD